MKILHKIVAAPAVAMGFLIVLDALSHLVMHRQDAALHDMYENRYANSQLAAYSAQSVAEVHSSLYRLSTLTGRLQPDQIKEIADEQKGRIDGVIKAMSGLVGRPEVTGDERKLAEPVLADLVQYRSDMDTAVDASAARVGADMGGMQTADTGFKKLIKEFDQLVKLETDLAKTSFDDAGSLYSRMSIAVVAMTLLALAICGMLTVFMSRKIVRPLRQMIEVAGRIANGDLTEQVEAKGNDETAELLRAVGNMSQSLAHIVTDVRVGTEAIATASRQIAAGNQDLSQRTEAQAANLEETASSMEELTGTVKQNANNARQASQLAASASAIAVKGGVVVTDVVQTMGAITNSSKRIADIIGVIDGIAFQTNILALNAAVEAARAGEQGRGFAVVASEVRNLAQRSAAAAKEIKALIDDSVGKIESGAKLADQAGSTMAEVVTSIKRVTDIMAEITAASQEQSSGIAEVNQAVTQMDQATQQNAALVEEAAAAAESMQEQAQQLAQAVAVFKIEATAEGATLVTKPVAAVPAPGIERRGPNRARNVARLPAKPVTKAADKGTPSAAKTGTDNDWTEF